MQRTRGPARLRGVQLAQMGESLRHQIRREDAGQTTAEKDSKLPRRRRHCRRQRIVFRLVVHAFIRRGERAGGKHSADVTRVMRRLSTRFRSLNWPVQEIGFLERSRPRSRFIWEIKFQNRVRETEKGCIFQDSRLELRDSGLKSRFKKRPKKSNHYFT